MGKTNSIRVLETAGAAYEARTYPPDLRSAVAIATALGVPTERVYKTLVVLRPPDRPFLVMVPGDRELDTKIVARAVGAKRVQMASHKEAERLTGLRVGGISALSLVGRGFEVFLDRSAVALESIFVSGGKRGLNLRLSVDDLLRVTNARVIDAAATAGPGGPDSHDSD